MVYGFQAFDKVEDTVVCKNPCVLFALGGLLAYCLSNLRQNFFSLSRAHVQRFYELSKIANFNIVVFADHAIRPI